MLIDVSYFTDGPRHILNASLGKMPNLDAEAVNATIKAYICHWQRKFLNGVLERNYASVVDNYLKLIDKDPGTDPEADADMVIEQLREPFANFVFFKILRDANTQPTVTGLVRLKCANEYVAPLRRQVSAWNEMVDLIRDFHVWARAEGYSSWLGKEDNLLTKINTLNL